MGETENEDRHDHEASGITVATEVVAKARRRRFTAAEKLRVLEEADRCTPGELGALLRREGLYTSHLSAWRVARRRGELTELRPRPRRPKSRPGGPPGRRIAELERELSRITARLERAEGLIAGDSGTKPSAPRPTQADLLEALPDPVVVCSADGQIVSATDHFCRRLGLPEGPGEIESGQMAPAKSQAASNAFLRLFNSHFRNTINEIANDIRLVAEKDLGADVRALVERIDTATTGLVGLTNLLVERWMIEVGEITSECIDFDLRTTLPDIEHTLAAMAQETDNTLTTDFDLGLPRALRGDPTRLRQVVVALATFLMARGRGLTIHWRCKWDRITDRAVRLHTSFEVDTAHIAPQVFQKALEEDSLHIGPTEGLLEPGLGPYHARQLAVLLGGDAGWETGLDKLVLWATVSLERQVQETREVPRKLRGRVLVVSGSPKEVDRWVEALRERTWDVTGATTQGEALHLIGESLHTDNPFHILVVTLVLPDGAAEQMASQVFTLAGLGKVHMVVVADVGRPGDAEWARQIGFSAYLVRPLKEKTLHGVLLELDRHTRAHQGNIRRIFFTRHSLADKARPPLWILVVDDDELVCLSVSHALQRLGHQVYVAENGEQALELCDRARFDLILLDINMPGENGDQIALLLRSRERSSGELPAAIIGITSELTTDNRQRCLASGMNDLVPKPLDINVLMGILDSMNPEEALLRVWQPARGGFGVVAEPKPAAALRRQNPSLASLMGMSAFERQEAERKDNEASSESEAA